MQDYSIAFLDQDWIGKGLVYEVYCIFDRRRVTSVEMVNFFWEASTRLRLHKLRIEAHSNLAEREEIDVITIHDNKAVLEKAFPVVPAEIFAVFSDAKTRPAPDRGNNLSIYLDPSIYMYFYSPDELTISVTSDEAYSGSWIEDRSLAENIVELVFIARDRFGDAIADYGADGWIEDTVYEQEKMNSPPNINENSEKNEWVEKILKWNYEVADIDYG